MATSSSTPNVQASGRLENRGEPGWRIQSKDAISTINDALVRDCINRNQLQAV